MGVPADATVPFHPGWVGGLPVPNSQWTTFLRPDPGQEGFDLLAQDLDRFGQIVGRP